MGSNPTADTFDQYVHGNHDRDEFITCEVTWHVKDTLAEWLRRRPAKPVGSAREGSNPSGVVFVKIKVCARSVHMDVTIYISSLSQHWSSGYDDCLTRSRSPVQSWDAVLFFPA